MSWTLKFSFAFFVTFASFSTAYGQPLVTGNLSFYYDFDEIVVNADGEKQFLDESGNGLVATVFEGDPEIDIEPGTVIVDDNAFRGAGAARLIQSTEAGDGPVYVDLGGRHITQNFPNLLPTSGLNEQFGLTISAWLNVTANDVSDQSILQGRTSDGGHGAPHFQLQGSGKFRMTLRDQTSGNVVNAPQVFIDGTEDSGEVFPVDEWFHLAGTYDAESDLWAMYYNGAPLQDGEGEGGAGDLGDWGGLDDDLFGLGLGAVYDSGGRRLDGAVDELYVFNRALSAEEIATLGAPVVSMTGDCSGDGSLNAADLECVATIAERDAVLGALGALLGDLDGDGDVAFADFLTLSGNFGKAGQSYAQGNVDLEGEVAFADFLALSGNFGKSAAAAAAVPEPASFAPFALAVLLLGVTRRKRK